MAIVSLYCHDDDDDDDDDCVITDNVITVGNWIIGDPATDKGGVGTTEDSKTWPHQMTIWRYSEAGEWHIDPLLTVTGT